MLMIQVRCGHMQDLDRFTHSVNSGPSLLHCPPIPLPKMYTTCRLLNWSIVVFSSLDHLIDLISMLLHWPHLCGLEVLLLALSLFNLSASPPTAPLSRLWPGHSRREGLTLNCLCWGFSHPSPVHYAKVFKEFFLYFLVSFSWVGNGWCVGLQKPFETRYGILNYTNKTETMFNEETPCWQILAVCGMQNYRILPKTTLCTSRQNKGL